MAFSIQEWLENLSKNEILFLFKGEVSSTLIADSLDEIELKIDNASNRAKKKIYNVLVECMQNLLHHSAVLPNDGSTEEKGKYAICLLSKNSVGYHIITGNFVVEAQKNFLTKHIDHINTLDNDALKDLYKDILNNQEFSAKGGGGLGMVDITRKSGSHLDYKFYEYQQGFYFFSLIINIIDN
jgi:hypothetical protein